MSRYIFMAVGGVVLLLGLACAGRVHGQGRGGAGYAPLFSTYFGGEGDNQGRGIIADAAGNVYVTGGTAGPGFPILNGTPVNTDKITDPTCRENMDSFVAKFNPQGKLLWSTALGGPNYDRSYALAIDKQGNVFVGGRGGWGFPVTKGVFQEKFCGVPNSGGDPYGHDDSFIAKLDPNGKVLWASFLGEGPNLRSMAIDNDGDLYVQICTWGNAEIVPDWYGGPAFAHAWQKTPNPKGDNGIAKISGDGTRILWATWCFNTANKTGGVGAIRVDNQKRVLFLGNTDSTDLITTAGAAQKQYGGGPLDVYLARLSADGSQLVSASYWGGTGNEYNQTHNLGVDAQGNAIIATQTTSPNLPASANAFQKAAKNAKGTIEIAKISPEGTLLACTYLGGSTSENVDGVACDAQGNIYLSGDTTSADFPTTPNALQPAIGAKNTAVFVKLSPDLTQLLYSTFLGGASFTMGRDCYAADNGTYYLIGQTNGAGWPLANAYQAAPTGKTTSVVAAFAAVVKER